MLIDVGVFGQDILHRQVVAQADFEVVRVVGWRDLDDTRAKFAFNIGVCDDRDGPSGQRQDDVLADQVLVAFVFGMDGDSRVAEQRFRARRGQDEVAFPFHQRITQMVKMAVLFFVFDLGVRNGRQAGRTPVDDPLATVNQALFKEADEDLLDGIGTTLVEGKSFAAPVTGGAKAFELLDDPAAIQALPFPGALEEFLAAEVLFADAFLAHGFDDLGFGRNRGMVSARQPECSIALHALEADQDILQRIVQGVAHMQLAGDVRRRDHDGIRFFRRIRLGGKIAPVLPVLVDRTLHHLRFKSFLD